MNHKQYIEKFIIANAVIPAKNAPLKFVLFLADGHRKDISPMMVPSKSNRVTLSRTCWTMMKLHLSSKTSYEHIGRTDFGWQHPDTGD
ncbi:unnamed protein product [Fusarium venenatum]|uniref:Uncharacterized protein n=1 Tax=Fusarium venenatum TaxID=56646 RepID=A0A2L2TWQ4_9HYPO|nr:uncharacterized protein FVRRES_09033 [Fusarium venenatum]CEI68956.1 unnamed protein product [Fusarium venenatum]